MFAVIFNWTYLIDFDSISSIDYNNYNNYYGPHKFKLAPSPRPHTIKQKVSITHNNYRSCRPPAQPLLACWHYIIPARFEGKTQTDTVYYEYLDLTKIIMYSEFKISPWAPTSKMTRVLTEYFLFVLRLPTSKWHTMSLAPAALQWWMF